MSHYDSWEASEIQRFKDNLTEEEKNDPVFYKNYLKKIKSLEYRASENVNGGFFKQFKEFDP